MKRALAVLLWLSPLWGDAGVLIPAAREKVDPKLVSLQEMRVKVLIDNGDARVSIRQVYASRYGGVLEGDYIFALPSRAAISDFAVWDGVTRIPGVILERRRAEEIYAGLKWQAIDPGLLQQGERDADEARRSPVFSARIVPIPAYGSKRVEIEYHERLPVEDLESVFALPLRPDAYQAQTAGLLSLEFELRTEHPLGDFQVRSAAYPFAVRERTANSVKGGFEARNITFTEDFAVRYALAPPQGDTLKVLTHRQEGPGFFEAALLMNRPAAESGAPCNLLLLFDTSLSMQWEKLERSYQALESILRSLRPADRFNLLLFNSVVEGFAPAPVAAEAAAVEQALAFVKASRLRGGTDLQAALDAALKQAAADTHLVLLGDGGATRGAVSNAKLAAWYAGAWKARRPHTCVFAVGDDANLPLLKLLARHGGVLEWVRSTEPADFKLKAFVSKIGRRPAENLRLSAAPAGNFDLIYPLEESVFAGSLAAWVGQYRRPAPQALFTAGAARASAPLPERSAEHPHLPRTWARARVDALLEKIEREGEDSASIDEIIRLSRQYKFVTPYTSFLAAPRALLRPRLIRPGDPVLRVRTDPAIVSVVAMFPFGLVKPLRYLPEEDIWQTRFLAPADMPDGTHHVRLILRDRKGQAFRESKSFIIASRPPLVRVRADRSRVRRGETVKLRGAASATTRTITARMYGVGPVSLRWNSRAASNTGEFVVPAHLPAGRYTLTVTAEDFAHNIASQEVSIEVAP